MTTREAVQTATSHAFDLDHTDDTRKALRALRSAIAEGCWAPKHVDRFRSAIALLSALS